MRILFVLVGTLLVSGVVYAGELAGPFGGTFDYSLVVQNYVESTGVSNSNANPGNQVSKIPETQFVQELRPELKFTQGMLELQVSPRAQFQFNKTKTSDGVNYGWNNSAYINGWIARLNPGNAVSLSVGREVLLWGPAMSLSPSNPFYIDNGRTNPYIELPGEDFAKIIWVPGKSWTVSYINNFGKGRKEPPPLQSFHRAQVLKIDYSGNDTYLSANYASIQGSPDKIGFSAQKTVSDALLVYMEGGYSFGRTQYLPAQNGNGQWYLSAPKGSGLSGIGLLGMSYTLASGPTFTVEYIYNNQGWSASQARGYQTINQNAASQLGGPETGFAMQQLALGFQPGSVLLRRNYLFVQYFQQNLFPSLDLTMRMTRNLDDNGTQWGAIIERNIGKRSRLFVQLLLNTGGTHTEFSRFIGQQFLVGLRTGF
ncbi:conserved exported hypothetical protein [Paraburkholderia ribeironis]|uniref:Porin n=1 Tax=Paraburkholderia ribeironis TaxID=1247936 RepID=A0A1N7S754_9BURK|nr:hypothetical protein [Paraburkholderia ribeironis]SIT43215.1 conserved exported hypothetical protein [Paraburkholderia ribeironis]